ncbi:hypothetical protein BCR33DRAFT_715611, partial [Rhizoclosmatium globosum]
HRGHDSLDQIIGIYESLTVHTVSAMKLPAPEPSTIQTSVEQSSQSMYMSPAIRNETTHADSIDVSFTTVNTLEPLELSLAAPTKPTLRIRTSNPSFDTSSCEANGISSKESLNPVRRPIRRKRIEDESFANLTKVLSKYRCTDVVEGMINSVEVYSSKQQPSEKRDVMPMIALSAEPVVPTKSNYTSQPKTTSNEIKPDFEDSVMKPTGEQNTDCKLFNSWKSAREKLKPYRNTTSNAHNVLPSLEIQTPILSSNFQYRWKNRISLKETVYILRHKSTDDELTNEPLHLHLDLIQHWHLAMEINCKRK